MSDCPQLHRVISTVETASREDVNLWVAGSLKEMASLLEDQAANPFRINAYRRAARTLEGLDEPVDALYRRSGREGLMALPSIGEGIATAIENLLRTGRLPQLERLRGSVEPETVFDSLPGVGPRLAAAIHDTLHVDTLEELEVAAHDGRLQTVPGIGPSRAASIRALLAERLKRPPRRALARAPSVAAILDADGQYRREAAAGRLRTIAPRRFNPSHKAWLPVLHTDRNDWHMTLLFSNTARAHELGKTDDWVVVYYYDGDHNEGQCTVVTETAGPRRGARVVRGRENEA
jgi:putative hydrolase